MSGKNLAQTQKTMTSEKKVRIALAGTSWWSDTMYMPALSQHSNAEVLAVLGRNREKADMFAEKWSIPSVYTDENLFIAESQADAVIVATSNKSHYPLTMKSLEAGKHVLCEKPLGLNQKEAMRMAEFADELGLITMTPFTYRYMPVNRYVKRLIGDGYIGTPYHLNMRYYAAFGRNSDYSWRFDRDQSGSGALGDIGSHFLYLAYWFFGELEELSCVLGFQGERPEKNPDGDLYELADDSAILQLKFKSGAFGSLHISSMAYEDTKFKQIHQYELHGSEGSIHTSCDWDREQLVSSAKLGEGPVRENPIPEDIWEGVRRDTVHNTYRDVFRTKQHMAREFVDAIVSGQQIKPSFASGALIQKYIDAAIKSHKYKRWVKIDS
ncbi:MAG: Gfo/Idh/MocA family protein [Oligoflexales bacterium]